MINKINKLSPAAAILIGCVLLGVFYCAIEIYKQISVEGQQNEITNGKSNCSKLAQAEAILDYEMSPTCSGAYTKPPSNCTDGSGTYIPSKYDSYYSTCLESKGLK